MSDVIVGNQGFSSGFSTGFATTGLEVPLIIANVLTPNITLPQIVSVNTLSATFNINNPTITVELGDFFDCPPFNTNDWFQKDTNCADNERELYEILQMDAWNSFGVNMVYYVTDYSQTNDSIYGEDMDRTVLRGFDATGFMEQLPREDRNVPLFGIEGLDLFKVYINKLHFTSASTYSASQSGVYNTYTPQTGDIIYLSYNDIYYEITHVKDKVEQFLQRPHAWDLSVREYKDFHLTLSATVSSTVSASTLSAYVDQNDYIEINNDIDTEKTSILYTSGATEEPPNDPFAMW